jgi:hypothetical protein
MSELLTEAQERFLLSLPPNGEWKRTREAELSSYGKNALKGFGKRGLVDGHYGLDGMAHRLTPEGQRMAAALRKGTSNV